jgi:UDP-N-acetylmuramate-alanine ligase
MPYYIFQKLVKTSLWECVERHSDFQAASKAKNVYKVASSERRSKDVLVTMAQGDTESVARAILENRTDEPS